MSWFTNWKAKTTELMFENEYLRLRLDKANEQVAYWRLREERATDALLTSQGKLPINPPDPKEVADNTMSMVDKAMSMFKDELGGEEVA